MNQVLQPELLEALREMGDLTVAEFAEGLGVPELELVDILAGRVPAPTRFDPLAYNFVDQVIRDKGFC